MKKIDLTSLLRKLITDYEKVFGIQTFEIKKINNLFVLTNVNQNIIESLKKLFNCNFTPGNTITDLPIIKEFKEKILPIYEIAWKGKEIANFEFFSCYKIIVVYSLKAIQKNGQTEKLEGHCVLLENKEFPDFIKLDTSSK